ncbi:MULTISPECIES: MFS transporter [Xanthomonas]|uniref:MFS transporter n=1 Tax=Xanthomonas TaxID=338 RepID=UPI001ADD17D6|nr:MULTISPECIES: MFS transporter [unclassified Xanthomonas]MBO9874999.1 MFS transporter [Xanthomonas sp. D-93]WNH45733.1 MFS transporter [Xanthomonas sp. A6251]
MPRSSPLSALPRLPQAALAAYAGAHFGKSLLWYAGELLLIYSLTEHAGLRAIAAGLVLALGLLLSAAIGLGAGWGLRRRLRDVRSAGRLQWHGLAAAALALLLVFAAPLLPPPWRLGYVLAVSLLFRLAYAACDVAQNTLLSLAQWPWRGHDGASALRLAGSGAAALLISSVVGAVLARGTEGSSLALQASAVLAAVAMLCAWQLQRVLGRACVHPLPADAKAVTASDRAPSWRAIPWQPLALIAAISLTLPAFTKLAPYVAAYGLLSPGWGSAVLIAYALGTVLVQPLAARWGRQRTPTQRLAWLGGALLLCAPLFALALPAQPLLSLAAAACIGAIGGSGGQLVWAWHAQCTATRAVAEHALCFAALTAAAQVALAAGVVLIGLLLDALSYRDGHCLLLCWAMAAGPLLCGALCLLLAWLTGRGRSLPVGAGLAANVGSS